MLFEFGFNFFTLFVPDVMHEFDLGVWKAILLHLLRILFAAGEERIQELNRRYREVPAFGRIRSITKNVSGLKQLAAHDFEDLLVVSTYEKLQTLCSQTHLGIQCSMSVFDGLLISKDPQRNAITIQQDKIVLDLLFTLNEWMALVKLRMVTTSILAAIDETVANLGKQIRLWNAKVSYFSVVMYHG